MEESKTLSSIEQVKAISDPYKFRILKTFSNMNEPATVKQIADRLNEVPAKVHYHVKKMEKLGILELVHTKEINGIIAKYYEPTAKHFEVKCDEDSDDANKAAMLGETQRMIAELYNASKNVFIEEVSLSAKNNERANGKLIMADLNLSGQQVKELSKCIEEFIKKNSEEDETACDKDKYHCLVSYIKLSSDNDSKSNPKCKMDIS